MSLQPLVLVGGGGHASDVLQVVEAVNAARPTYRIVGVLDDQDIDRHRFEGRGADQIGAVDDIGSVDAAYVLCAGWPSVRRALADRIGDRGRPVDRIVHPFADIGAGVELGPGTVVFGHSHVSPHVRLGAHGMVAYLASMGHDCHFGEHASIMPNSAVSGQVRGGDAVLVGAGAVILQGVCLGDDCRVGAGAVVIDDVSPGATVAGVPARPIW